MNWASELREEGHQWVAVSFIMDSLTMRAGRWADEGSVCPLFWLQVVQEALIASMHGLQLQTFEQANQALKLGTIK